jgi:hypothetical protein
MFPPDFFNILTEPLLNRTETNDTSTERSVTQLFEAGKSTFIKNSIAESTCILLLLRLGLLGWLKSAREANQAVPA